MIVTKEWLKEWLDIKNFSTECICKTFNSIGLEVDSLKEIRIPSKVVIGKVVECEKHPNADKLSICKVDINSGIKQIVCGASNVAKNQFVPVALEGAVVFSKDGNSFTIKDSTLRGVKSEGMICSSTEIGLPFISNGILVLDNSIGDLILGKELSQYPLLNDDVIEIELTANRGDCQNVYGIARDLSAALDLKIKKLENYIEDGQIGIARVLKIDTKHIKNTSFEYAILEKKSFTLPFLIALRMAYIEKKIDNDYEKIAFYATYNTGVLLRLYSGDVIEKDNSNLMHLTIQNDDLKIPTVYSKKEISKVTLEQNKESIVKNTDEVIIVEASYIDPNYISHITSDIKNKDFYHYYIASRGSNPDLEFGIKYLFNTFAKNGDFKAYSGRQQIINDTEKRIISVGVEQIDSLIGQKIEKTKIVKILQSLSFEVSTSSDENAFYIKVPRFRHDIVNFQDIVEEIVRMVGIDNIKSSPIKFIEKRRINNFYNEFKKRQYFRKNSANNGFYESLHYFFTSKEMVVKYGYETITQSLELSNPITSELNTLRPTLLLNLLNSASNNHKLGKKSIKLFEIGRVVNVNRVESEKIAFIFSGNIQREDISNNAKPKNIDFFYFAKKISNIIGDFEIILSQRENKLVSPYEYGEIIKNNNSIGFIARTHLDVENDFDLPTTYICEIDFDKLRYVEKNAKKYSKFQSLSRDLSLLVPKTKKYAIIREFLSKSLPKEVVEFFPVDIYESEELKDNFSLTIKFNIQSDEKTMHEEEISQIMQNIIYSLEQNLGISIR